MSPTKKDNKKFETKNIITIIKGNSLNLNLFTSYSSAITEGLKITVRIAKTDNGNPISSQGIVKMARTK